MIILIYFWPVTCDSILKYNASATTILYFTQRIICNNNFSSIKTQVLFSFMLEKNYSHIGYHFTLKYPYKKIRTLQQW